ncbi:MAG: YceD family protein [Porcipelethomonas sp.]
MTADLRQVFNTSGAEKEFGYEIPLSELERCKGYSFADTVKVSGSFYNRADVVHMDYSVKFTLNIVCDRCLKEFERKYSYDFQHVIVSSVNKDNDEYIIAEDYRVDVNEIALSDLLLELPTKLLCSDDCKGLCSVCGCDLNESECNCQK